MNNNTLLEVKGICKSYKGRKVVNDVSLQVSEGEFVGLLGPNGAGKTTSFRMCMGMVAPDSGDIFLRGHNVTQQAIHQRARLGLGYLAQEASVFRKLSVEENLIAILELTGHELSQRQAKCEKLIEEFGLGHIRKSLGEVLSGGERRRLEIARALATDPAIILLDEPFSGIDPVAVEDIQEILTGLEARGIAILLTDHNVRETLHITERAYIMAEGKVLAEGSPKELVANEQVRKVYLGKRFELA